MWNPTIRIAVPSGSLFTGGQYLSPDKSCKCNYHTPICGEEWPDCEIEVALTSWTTYWAQPLFAVRVRSVLALGGSNSKRRAVHPPPRLWLLHVTSAA